jgi:hypothetical protein
MTSLEDVIWQDLVATHNADQIQMPSATHVPPRGHRGPRLAVGAGGLAAATAAAVLVLSGTSGTPPAYALTANANGSYTLTINDLKTAIPEVNAEFAKLGVHAKAIPVTSTCTAPDTAGIPLFDYGTANTSESMTVDNANIPSGWTAFLAVEQMPNGHVAMAIGTTPEPLPACLNSNQPLSTATPASPTGTDTYTTGS